MFNRRKHADVALFVVLLALVPALAPSQLTAPAPVRLPSSVGLSDVHIQLQTGGGDGCVGRCTVWRVLLKGDGMVELHDLGTPPREEPRQRTIGSDSVVGLINRFLKARFWESLDYYGGVSSAVRNGDSLRLFGGGAGTGPWTELTLRIGPATKTVRLHENIPAELQDLNDRVWKLGGPEAWEK
jgi:hypothetical protein